MKKKKPYIRPSRRKITARKMADFFGLPRRSTFSDFVKIHIPENELTLIPRFVSGGKKGGAFKRTEILLSKSQALVILDHLKIPDKMKNAFAVMYLED